MFDAIFDAMFGLSHVSPLEPTLVRAGAAPKRIAARVVSSHAITMNEANAVAPSVAQVIS